MANENLNIRRRNLPHWSLAGSLYFVTFRVANGTLSDVEKSIVLQHLLEGAGRFYRLPSTVIMPDHVHLLVQPLPPYDLSRVLKGIKGVSARKINLNRQSQGQIWQDESWDRLVRDAEEFSEKLRYMADNPLKAELVKCQEDYPYWHCDKELI